MHPPVANGKGVEPAVGPTALSGLRVLDFGQYVAGPLLALMLADQGAEVIRIDPPGGPRWRPDGDAVLQRGKRRLCLDLKAAPDLEVARALVATADVLVENFRPGVMARLGLGDDACRRLNPRLVYVSLPGFGRDDPRAALAGWEGVVSAASGLFTPYPAHRRDIPGAGVAPAVSAVTIASNFAAFIGVNAVMAALIARERDGLGERLEIPLFAAAFEALIAEGQSGPPPTHNSFYAAADNRFLCADGRWVQLLMIAPRHLDWFVRRFLPQLVSEGLGEIDRIREDPAAASRLLAALAALFKTRPAADWDALVNQAGVPLAVCQTTGDFLAADAQARAAGAVIELSDPQLGPTTQLGYPVGLSLTPPRAQGPRRPLDADRVAILAELAARPTSPAPSPSPSPSPCEPSRPLPLSGVRVVDISQVFAAPTATRILAQFGAQVVKINPLDSWLIGHLHFNSGKQSILMDLHTGAGRETLLRLLQEADVFVHNLRSDAVERLGVDEASVRQASPEIVYGQVTPYGHVGDKAEFRGWEPVGQATTGLHLRTGGGDRPQPARFPLCDFGTGNLFAFALLLGLWVKLRTGRGQRVQSSLMQAGAYHQASDMLAHAGQGPAAPARPQLKGAGPHDRLYQASDGWLYVRARDLAALRRTPGLWDAGQADEPALEAAFRALTVEHWLEALATVGVCAHRMATVGEAMVSEEAKAQRLSIVRQHRGVGEVRSIGPIPRFSSMPLPILAPAPAPGGDTRAVLSALYGEAHAAQLIESGVAAERLAQDVMIVW
jgi:crotonobetainyl-CoA:carnitine CoA-transferase CaiB-like acyl-CoA transferase